MRIALGADHAGFGMKNAIAVRLAAEGHQVDDVGTFDDASVDYPDFAAAVGRLVSSGRCDRGILVCGTGLGMSIAANKVPGIRAAVVADADGARLSREHNDANVIALGARVTPEPAAYELVRIFLETPFAGGRHQLRVNKINALDAHEPA